MESENYTPTDLIQTDAIDGITAVILSPEAFELFKEEWKQCEAGIARYDSLMFQLRGWAIALTVAVVAATVNLRRPEMALVGVLGALLFWFNEALHDTYQAVFISRSHELQSILRAHVIGTVSEQFLSKPMIAEKFRNEWRKGRFGVLRSAVRSARYLNVCFTYISLIVVCLACYVATSR